MQKARHLPRRDLQPVPMQSVAAATPLEGPILQRYLKLAQEHSLWLSLGGFQEYCSTDPKRLLNCHVIVNAAGEIVSTYRKVHLFDVEVFNGPVLKETSFTVPGKEVLLAFCHHARKTTFFVLVVKYVRVRESGPCDCSWRHSSKHLHLLPPAEMVNTQYSAVSIHQA